MELWIKRLSLRVKLFNVFLYQHVEQHLQTDLDPFHQSRVRFVDLSRRLNGLLQAIYRGQQVLQ